MAYSDLVLYLESFGIPKSVCEAVGCKYQTEDDLEGFIDFALCADKWFEVAVCS